MKLFFKLIKKPFFGKFMVKWKNPMTEKDKIDWTELSFQSNSGALLKGLYASSRCSKAKATIVLGHPMGKEAKGFYLKNGYTDILRNNGYNVLIFDINGFGESEVGNFLYHKDIIAAGKVAEDIFPEVPLGYLGISLGGQWATIAFAEDHNYEFAIVESAANTLEEFWIKFPMANIVLKVMGFLNPRLKKKICMIDRIKDAHSLKEVLFIYLDNDELIKDNAGTLFSKAIPIPSEVHVISNTKHAQIPKSSSRDQYFNTIISFFDAQIKTQNQ